MTDDLNTFLRRVHGWGARESERGTVSDLPGAAKYYACVVLGDEGRVDEVLSTFERVYAQGRDGTPLTPEDDI